MSRLSVAIMIGTNVEDREEKLARAREAVAGLLTDCRMSSVMDSPDFTGKGNDYLNQVIIGYLQAVDEAEAVEMLYPRLKKIETSLGRDRAVKEIVAADIDLVAIAPEGEFKSEKTKIVAPREAGTYIFKRLLSEAEDEPIG